MDLFKDIIPSITTTGVNLLENEKDYNPYVVNTALSLHLDTILLAEEMNFNNHLPKKLQYDYLLNKTRHYKRQYQQWPKKQKSEDLEVIMKYYDCSLSKAKEYARVLTEEAIEEIRNELDEGGVSKTKKR